MPDAESERGVPREGDAARRASGEETAPGKAAARSTGLGEQGAAQQTWGQIIKFGLVGVASTLFYLALFPILKWAIQGDSIDVAWLSIGSEQVANFLALAISTVANTSFNRWWTFGVRGRQGAALHQAQGMILFLAHLALTAFGLWLLHELDPSPTTFTETVVVGLATVVITIAKFSIFRRYMRPSAA